MEDRQWLGVKELADTVGVSRQTLIYYDSIDLFKPEFIDTNGYRKYSTSQIMELREILFLKNNNVPLEVIKANIKKKSLDNIKKGLKASREKMLTDIESMNRKVEKNQQPDLCIRAGRTGVIYSIDSNDQIFPPKECCL